MSNPRNIQIEIRDTANNHEGTLDVRLHRDFPLALSYSVAEIRDIDRRGGGWSENFLIPASNHNNDVLNRIFDTNLSNDTENTLNEKTASVVIDGVPVLSGYLRVNSVSGHKYPQDYDLNMYGENLDWVNRMDNCRLKDLNWGTITIEASTFEQNWSDFDNFTTDFVFALVHYGDFSGFKNAEPPEKFVRVEDLRPALRIEHIVRQSLEDVGYTLVSDFWDGNDPVLDARRLVMPHIGQGWTIDDADITAAEFSADTDNSPNPGIDTFNLVNNNPSGYTHPLIAITASDIYKAVFNNESPTSAFYDNATGVFTGVAGRFRFDLDATFDYGQTNANFGHHLIIAIIKEDAGGNLTRLSTTVHDETLTPFVGLPTSSVSGHAFTVALNTNYADIKATDKVYVGFWLSNNSLSDGSTRSLDVRVVNGSLFFNDAADAIIRGQTVDIDDVVPDVDCFDVILGVKHCFNLYFKTDVLNRKVYCEPRDTFYDTFANALDWSDMLDVRSIEVRFVSDYDRDLLFKYKKDSNDGFVEVRDEWAREFYDTLDYELFAGHYALPDRFPKGLSEIENPLFAPTYYIENDGKIGIASNRRFPTLARMWPENASSSNPPEVVYDYLPRILYYQYIANGGGIRWDDGTGQDWVTETIVPTAHPGGTDYAHDLGFPMLGFKNGTDTSGNKVKGLLENFYSGGLQTLEKGILLIADINLSLREINNLDFRIPIYFDRPAEIKGYWALEKVDGFRPADDDLTKCHFIKLENTGDIDLSSQGFAKSEIHAGLTGDGKDNEVKTGQIASADHDYGAASQMIGPDNFAVKNAGSAIAGSNNVSLGTRQSVTGRYNKASTDDIWQVGAGLAGELSPVRRNAVQLKTDGEIRNYGGQMFTTDANGEIIPLLDTDDDGNYRFVYLDDSLE